MRDLKGICALVSGGASELGSEIIRQLATRGASILAVDSTEEKVEDAIAKLGLENPDEIFISAIEGGDVVSWWDLANLVAAYFHTLNFFVHIAEPGETTTARTLGVDALRAAQASSSDSFVTAMARLEKYLVAASKENDEGACVVAVTVGASGDGATDDVLASTTHATSAALASALAQEYEAAGLDIRVHAFLRNAADSATTAAAGVVDLLNQNSSD